MIGIIGAMAEEVQAIKDLMEIDKIEINNGYHFIEGKLEGKDVVLLRGGVGKVNAAISATLLLTSYDIECVINIGTAGGLITDEQEVGDVVISDRIVHHDADVTGFGYPMGAIPGQPVYFEPDPLLLNKAKEILEDINITCHVGLIASGDSFICRQDQVDLILKNFPDSMCSEMEAATIAQVCTVFKKKFIITRSLSDVFNKGESTTQFEEFLAKAAASSAKMCAELVKSL